MRLWICETDYPEGLERERLRAVIVEAETDIGARTFGESALLKFAEEARERGLARWLKKSGGRWEPDPNVRSFNYSKILAEEQTDEERWKVKRVYELETPLVVAWDDPLGSGYLS